MEEKVTNTGKHAKAAALYDWIDKLFQFFYCLGIVLTFASIGFTICYVILMALYFGDHNATFICTLFAFGMTFVLISFLGPKEVSES